MGEAARIEAGMAIVARLEGLRFNGPIVASGYLPIHSEIDIRPSMQHLARRGARLCLPAIVKGELEFREFREGASLEPQGFGTYAPGPQEAILKPWLMLVPLAAFDRRCHRIGYGRGYYDRAIAKLRAKGLTPLTIGTAFAVQEVERVPDEPHDVALDFIVTESEVLRNS
ncbi:5-formyltetrahydrofolate cyclo-ligase [Aureimonas psammosilenae]|uniref:5-formyltetrahydrofolate cyclo-ligase n=1 Tax=Aureimonas psammosilenae TaxID=2495496 RepID=UPI0038B3628B